MSLKTLPHPLSEGQDTPLITSNQDGLPPAVFDPSVIWPCPGDGRDFYGDSDPYFLIQGNNSSTPHEQGVCEAFDDFSPDYSSELFKDRLSRYAVAHGRAVEMASFIREKFKSVGEKFPSFGAVERAIATDLEECGSFLQFRHFYTINEIRLSAMCSCKRHLLCPLCAIRRAAKSVKSYLEKFNLIVEESPRLKPYLVTFTVANGDDLTERFEHLQKSLRKMYDHRRKALNSKSSNSRHRPNEACKASGGVGSFEVKRGSGSGGWHPHAHFIWLCEHPPVVAELSREWFQITGDSFIVDVTPFTDGKDVSRAFLEVFKYALKYSTMGLSDNWDAFTVLQRRRLVSSFGAFYGVEIPEQLTDEISFDDLPYIELVFRYLNGQYRLTQSTNPQGNERSE